MIFFAKKDCSELNGINFCVQTRKKIIIYEKLSTQKFTSDFNGLAQFLVSQNSKGKYESRKILDFVRKNEKNYFSKFLNFLYCFFYFLIILKFLYYFGILEFFKVFMNF
jgi:hypothetical protein